jgi:nuclear pore complex protein Nup205
LCYIERALASFDLESLVATPQDPSLKGESLVSLLIHPGYDIMKRLLTNSPLQASILSYIVDGVEGFEKEFADEEPFFRSTIIRVLRIVHRVLEIQDIFLDVLVPLTSDVDSVPIVGTVHPRSYYTRFDQALSFGPQYIPALAAYIAFPSHSELVLLSVKIITVLSASNSSDLATLIERSNDSERILRGFMLIINIESMEDVLQAETLADQTTGAGAPEVEEGQESLEQAIRLAALDLLIQGTDSSRRYPNIAHFLLFGGANNEQQVQDPHALGAHQTSIHVLLDLVNTGVPRLKGKDRHVPRATPLFLSLPGLAERCYRVISQLCTHPRTSDFTTRYLRTREDFFARQLACLPAQVPPALQDPYVQVLYNDGSRVTTTVPSMSSFLRLRSCIFDLVALDLHILTNKGHFKGVAELLDILFGNDPGHMLDSSPSLADDTFRPFQEVGQSHMRVIEFLQSLMFDWSDSLIVPPIELQFLGQMNLQLCVRKDATGCEIVDRTAVLSLLTAAKRALHTQGAIATNAQSEQLQREVTYILESCAVENHRREVTHAISTGYEAWRRLLDMTLTKCFDRLPHDRRENMLFDLLHVLPTAIRSIEIEQATAILLSEAVLSSITKLREDRRHQIVAQSAGGDSESGSLPAERLYSILQSILEGIIDNNRVELVRGNLYAALINYVHLIASPHADSDMIIHKGGDNLTFSLASSTTRGDSVFGSSQSLVAFSQSGRSQVSGSSLEIGSLAVMKGVMERLVATISRDAIDGTEVWKTVAFMLLDALVQLSGMEKQHGFLAALTRHGILSNFVRGVKESDSRLLAVLKPDPGNVIWSFICNFAHTQSQYLIR